MQIFEENAINGILERHQKSMNHSKRENVSLIRIFKIPHGEVFPFIFFMLAFDAYWNKWGNYFIFQWVLLFCFLFFVWLVDIRFCLKCPWWQLVHADLSHPVCHYQLDYWDEGLLLTRQPQNDWTNKAWKYVFMYSSCKQKVNTCYELFEPRDVVYMWT